MCARARVCVCTRVFVKCVITALISACCFVIIRLGDGWDVCRVCELSKTILLLSSKLMERHSRSNPFSYREMVMQNCLSFAVIQKSPCIEFSFPMLSLCSVKSIESSSAWSLPSPSHRRENFDHEVGSRRGNTIIASGSQKVVPDQMSVF